MKRLCLYSAIAFFSMLAVARAADWQHGYYYRNANDRLYADAMKECGNVFTETFLDTRNDGRSIVWTKTVQCEDGRSVTFTEVEDPHDVWRVSP